MSQCLPLGLSSACLGSDFALAVLPSLAEAGFTHLEVFPMDHPELAALDDFARLGEQARAAGLVTWSLHAPFGLQANIAAADEAARRQSMNAVRNALDQAAILGAKVVVVHSGYYRPGTEQRHEALLRAVDSYHELIAHGSPLGLRLAVEYLPPKPGDVGSSAAELLWLQDAIGGEIGFCADVNHINLAEDLSGAIRQLGVSLLTTHLSDNDGQQEQHWLPGQGVIDWTGLLETLEQIGYCGPLLLESGSFASADVAQRVVLLAEAARGLLPEI